MRLTLATLALLLAACSSTKITRNGETISTTNLGGQGRTEAGDILIAHNNTESFHDGIELGRTLIRWAYSAAMVGDAMSVYGKKLAADAATAQAQTAAGAATDQAAIATGVQSEQIAAGVASEQISAGVASEQISADTAIGLGKIANQAAP